jgi:hypothetical protein
MDEDTANADTVTVPVWGEVILDRSLFLLIPTALFAVGGIVTSLYVLANSGDAWVDAVDQQAIQQQQVTPAPASSEGCRGLCSSQERDLQSLRSFLSGFSK